ncbi:MAG TPA: AsnC family protein [Methylococcaceae bacterium]|nr:AsnC family protein [Methylococcaceae bacterium]
MIDEKDYQLLAQIADGLPLCSHPYAVIGKKIGLSEAQIIERLTMLQKNGNIKRLGVIVKHATLGYRANAMVVWRIPEENVEIVAQAMLQFSFVTLCYQRPMLPEWPYNLYCMIHGKNKETVQCQLAQLIEVCGLAVVDKQILFSSRCFKQRGAVYTANGTKK